MRSVIYVTLCYNLSCIWSYMGKLTLDLKKIRGCRRFCLPSCRWNNKCRIFLTTCPPRRLSQIFYLLRRCCSWIWMSNRNSFQNWRFWWFRQLRRPRRCTRMVSLIIHSFLCKMLQQNYFKDKFWNHLIYFFIHINYHFHYH